MEAQTSATEISPSAARAKVGLSRILWSSIIGSAIEWYDFLVYAAATSLVFDRLFFPVGDADVAAIAVFGAYAMGFVSRPLGAIVFGHFGDRIGRKPMLVATIMIMGVGTILIGLLPTYQQIGIAAPMLLIFLRFLQGIGIGGEWAGGVLMVVESTPLRNRGTLGSLVQIANPLGHVVAVGLFATLASMPEHDFLSWGWRVPFLASLLLVGVGLFIRNQLEETPAFKRILAGHATVGVPIVEMLRNHSRPFFIAVGLKLADIAYATIGGVFAISYIVKQLKLSPEIALGAVMIANIVALFTTPLFGWLSDRFGRKPLFYAGCTFCLLFAFPFFQMLETRDPVLVVVAVTAAINLGQTIMFSTGAAWYSELFAGEVRYTGASFGFQIGAVIGGGLTPVIASSAMSWSGGATWPISLYLIICSLITLLAVLAAPETAHLPLN
jgi:MHS family shikimate/dehydroshikimate transporter-like MFS transporter